MSNAEGEIWKSIELTSKYEVSNCGRIRQLYANGEYIVKNPYLSYNGKYEINIYIPLGNDKFKQKKCTMHSLIGKAFLENPNNYKNILFIDNEPLNLNSNNLVWSRSNRKPNIDQD